MAAVVATTVPEVIAHMLAIEASAPRADGVACFARLYREVTEGVNAELAAQGFGDPRFLERLDIVFANLFFSALDAFERNPAAAPSAWVPLFAGRSRKGIAPLQFAFCGMNAHINRDLPVALVATCEELGREPREGSIEHADYLVVNSLLARVEARVKASYLTGWLSYADRLFRRFDRIDDVIAMWNVERARDAAWTNGETLWALRSQAALSTEYLRSLDRMVGFAGRGLLVPADTAVRRLGRRLRDWF